MLLIKVIKLVIDGFNLIILININMLLYFYFLLFYSIKKNLFSNHFHGLMILVIL